MNQLKNMDLSETMKSVLAKNLQGSVSLNEAVNQGVGSTSSFQSAFPASSGYVTEKLYMLLQLYLQNKGWNPSVELLQCFSDLKDSAMLPSMAYLQMMAARITLDTQGRLILRENGKIILPYEHFANAVMLKHMAGPHGLHLGLDATVRAVMDSYTIGREQFGMEKEFIIEVVQNCPNMSCRYYKNQLDLTQKTIQQLTAAAVAGTSSSVTAPPSYLADATGGQTTTSGSSMNDFTLAMQSLPASITAQLTGPVDLTGAQTGTHESAASSKPSQSSHESHRSSSKSQSGSLQSKTSQNSTQQITAAIIQQQNRVMAQQNLEKQRQQQVVQQAVQQLQQHLDLNKAAAAAAAVVQKSTTQQPHFDLPIIDHKLTDFLRANLENLESLSSTNKDLLALHNGAWTNATSSNGLSDKRASSNGGTLNGTAAMMQDGGQEKIVRAFAEVMKNMARMKTYVRPSMCKPYGKQAEALQKTLIDTVQLVQSLRSFLPPPHIQVSSWKNEDKYRKPALDDLTMQ